MALARENIEKDSYTEEEYFEFERASFGRWEYVGGEIRAMSGGSDDHGAIAANLVRALGNILVPHGCRVYGSDIKIHAGDGANTFPDVSVVCGERVYHQGRIDGITNPLLIVEVLSPSTEGYDRGEKFDHYRTIPSLMDYLLVAQDKACVLVYTRQNDHWEFREVSGFQNAIYLPSVETPLPFADIYALIQFDTN